MPFVKFSPAADPLPPDMMQMWNGLASRPGQIDPVCCAPDWNLAYCEVFHPERRIFYLAIEDTFLVFSEFCSDDGRVFLTPLEDSWMFSSPMLGARPAELLRYATKLLKREYGSLPCIVIGGVRDPGPQAISLILLHNNLFDIYRVRDTMQGWASLSGGVDGWLARRSANHRAKLRKARRKAREHGIYFERVKPHTRAEGTALYDRMLAVENRSWKGRGHCGMAESPALEFYSALMRRYTASGSARVIMARVEDRDIGYIFGGINNGNYRGQQFSFDADYAAFSPGNLMQFEKVIWLAESGVLRYYMGPVTGPRMGYKEHWTENFEESQTWLMRPKIHGGPFEA